MNEAESDDDAFEAAADEPELTGPLRLCALTRAQRPVAELIRFVASPDGVMVADLARRLPGRGVWIEAHRASIEQAVRRSVFAKSLKRKVTAPPALAADVEALLLKRLLEALSLANKAGHVVPGFAKIEDAIATGKVVALFHGVDSAAGGQEKLDRKYASALQDSPFAGRVVTELTIDQMSLAIGRSNVVHAAITSGGAATRLLDEAGRLMRYRASPAASQVALTPSHP